MRQYISQEVMEETLKMLDSHIDLETHQEEIERIKRAKGTEKPLGYSTKPHVYVLWSDGEDHKTFLNNHRCWPLSGSTH